MAAQTQKLTFAEYLTYDNGTDKRSEFFDGELLEMPPVTGKHEDIITFLLFHFLLEIRHAGYSYHARPNGIEIWTGSRTRRPDIVVITELQRLEIQDKSAVLYSAPPLVVEVVSPTCRSVDTVDKVTEYQSIGIFEYWIVDPDLQQVSVLLLHDDGYIETVYRSRDRVLSQLFPDLVLTVEQILQAD